MFNMKLDIGELLAISNKGKLPTISDISKDIPYNVRNILAMGSGRVTYNENYGFSIITQDLVNEIGELLKGRHILEVGAGTGWLAHHIKRTFPELDYQTNDDGAWGFERQHHPVDISGDYVDIDLTPFDTIVCSWPDYQKDGLTLLLKRAPANTLVLLCAEPEGGCTGNVGLFALLESDYAEVGFLKSGLQFSGIHDDWVLYCKLEHGVLDQDSDVINKSQNDA